jgi:hypothetical protein
MSNRSALDAKVRFWQNTVDERKFKTSGSDVSGSVSRGHFMTTSEMRDNIDYLRARRQLALAQQEVAEFERQEHMTARSKTSSWLTKLRVLDRKVQAARQRLDSMSEMIQQYHLRDAERKAIAGGYHKVGGYYKRPNTEYKPVKYFRAPGKQSKPY